MKKNMSLADADEFGALLLKCIGRFIGPHRAEIAGSVRRREPVVGDIDLLMECELVELLKIPGMKMLHGGGMQGKYEWKGVFIDAWHVNPGTWGSMLVCKTGPKEHVIAYARIAQGMGMKLSPYGLYDTLGKIIASETEEEIYAALGKQCKHPSERGR